MAQYKVLQDIEAEDKLLGPLSLRQFLYAVVGIVLGFVMVQLFSIQPLLAIPFLPPTVLFFVLAAPFGRDQPSEVWLLAKIRFFLKPRQRVWDQAGLQELVTITVPKKIERQLTDGLSQTEVKSRLRALADTIDTRGWAIKGVGTGMANNPAYFQQGSDRLFDMNALMPGINPDANVPVENDPLAAYNPIAQQFTQMVAASDQAHRQQIMQRMDQIREQQASQQQAATAPTPNPIQANPQMQPTPQPLVTSQQVAYGNTHVLQPLGQPQASTAPPQNIPASPAPNTPMTPSDQAAKIELAKNNDLNIATIAREINKSDDSQDEVVISLH